MTEIANSGAWFKDKMILSGTTRFIMHFQQFKQGIRFVFHVKMNGQP